jgi:hypothetical protein
MEFLTKLQLKDTGGRRIRGTFELGNSYIITPASEQDVRGTGFTFPHAKISMDKVRVREDLTDDPVKQIVPKTSRYVPEAGGNAFIPGSAPPIPPVLAQSAIRTAGEAVALAKAAGKDPTKIKKLFNMMWGMPDDFDVGKYAPACNPERTKPWLRYGKENNYEIRYMKDAQAMIDVTNGSYTSSMKNEKKDIDFDRTRVIMRGIATTVTFCEPDVLEIAKKTDITLYFKFNPDGFETASEPTWNYNLKEIKIVNLMDMTQLKTLTTYERAQTKYLEKPTISLLKELPLAVVDDLKRSNQSLKTTLALESSGLTFNKADLMSSEYSNTAKIEIKVPKYIRKKLSLSETFKYSLKGWIMKLARLRPEIHMLYMYIQQDEFPAACNLAIELLPDKLLTFAYKLFCQSGREKYEYGAFKQLLILCYGDTTSYPTFTPSSVLSILAGALRMRIPNFLWIYRDAYRMSLATFQRLSIYDFIKVDTSNFDSENILDTAMHNAYTSIARVYVSRYTAKHKMLQEELKRSKGNDVKMKLKHKLRLYQARCRLYPTMGYIGIPNKTNEALVTMAKHYVSKRKRLKHIVDLDNYVIMTADPMINAKRLDEITHGTFTEFVKDSAARSNMTHDDIEKFSWEDMDYVDLPVTKSVRILNDSRAKLSCKINPFLIEEIAAKDHPDKWRDAIESTMLPNYVYKDWDEEAEAPVEVDSDSDEQVQEIVKVQEEIIPPLLHESQSASSAVLNMFEQDDDDDEGFSLNMITWEDYCMYKQSDYYPEAVKNVILFHQPMLSLNMGLDVGMLDRFFADKTDELMKENRRLKEQYYDEKYGNPTDSSKDLD